MDCIQCYSRPKHPRDGWFWICEECFNTMDSYAWVGKEIQKKIEKDGAISLDEINHLFEISFDVKRRFDNLHSVIKHQQKREVGE